MPKIYAVAGLSGSGKTKVADALVKHFQLQGKRCVKLSIDDYYRANPQPGTNFDDPASVELELFAEHLKALKNDQAIEVPTYSFHKENRLAETKPIIPDEHTIIIVEGIFALNKELCDTNSYDSTIYVDTRSDECLARRLLRDETERGKPIKENLEYFMKNMLSNLHFIEDTKKYADHVLCNSNPEDIEQLIEKIDPQTQQSAEPAPLSAPVKGFFVPVSARKNTEVPPESTVTTIGQTTLTGFGGSKN
ncbi:uridine kinase [Legionella nautarum]|uniref:Uridine kinase n=1 Tax=Legionella nautarum TaxID=45070 RepID=A0A0W0WKG5_9GAMM|nr:AAA family ATPase [Legionella nautarum]KTD32813.1 uridine kinase [Legionella nautarum]